MASDGWISVKTKLPDKEDQYFVLWGPESDPFAKVEWFMDGAWSGFDTVHHWMPIPALPEAPDAD